MIRSKEIADRVEGLPREPSEIAGEQAPPVKLFDLCRVTGEQLGAYPKIIGSTSPPR